MASGCAYCDDIDNIAKTLKQDIASQSARQRLAAKEPSLVKKIESGEQLTDNELDLLWKEENRSDAIDLMYSKNRNLVDDVATLAIKSGDETKITKVGDEIKKNTEICIRKGECGSDVGLAIGLGAIATVGTLGVASGVTWKFIEKEDAFYEITPLGEYETGLPSKVADAYTYLMSTKIPYKTYNVGNMPGVQGQKDKLEYMCQNFVIDAVLDTQNAGYNTMALSIVGTRDDGEEIHHAIMGIIDDSKRTLYAIDPTMGLPMIQGKYTVQETIIKSITDPRNYTPLQWLETGPHQQLFTSQPNIKLVEPDKGYLSPDAPASELIGKRMMATDGVMYTIKSITIIGTPKSSQSLEAGYVRTLPTTKEGFTTQAQEEYIETSYKTAMESGKKYDIEGVADPQAAIATISASDYKQVKGKTLPSINETLAQMGIF